MSAAGAGSQVLALARSRLVTEQRTGEALLVIAPFGAIALLLLPMGVGTDLPLLRTVGPGYYWLVILLFGVLLGGRHSGEDGPAQRALLTQCGVDPPVRLLGRIVADAVLLIIFQALLAPVAIALYDPDLAGWPWLLLVVPLVAGGLASLGALAEELTAGSLGRSTLAPLLVAPLALPLLLGATQALEAARFGRAPWPWVLLMMLADLVVLLGTLLSARILEDTA